MKKINRQQFINFCENSIKSLNEREFKDLRKGTLVLNRILVSFMTSCRVPIRKDIDDYIDIHAVLNTKITQVFWDIMCKRLKDNEECE